MATRIRGSQGIQSELEVSAGTTTLASVLLCFSQGAPQPAVPWDHRCLDISLLPIPAVAECQHQGREQCNGSDTPGSLVVVKMQFSNTVYSLLLYFRCAQSRSQQFQSASNSAEGLNWRESVIAIPMAAS